MMYFAYGTETVLSAMIKRSVRGVVKGYINTYLVHDYNSLHRKTIRLNGGIESGRRGLFNASPVVHKYWSKC